MKNLLLLLFAFLFTNALFSQNAYIFNADSLACPKVKVHDCQQKPYFSMDVSIMLEQFTELYTRKVASGPQASYSCVEIDKPDLYYSIKRLSNYYSKGLKKGIISKDEAEKELQGILQKCMAIHSLKTDPIENELKSANHPDEILAVFQKIIIE